MAWVTVERWQHTPDVEVFYDLSARKMLYKKYTWIYTQCVDSGQRNDYHDLPVLESKCLGAALSPSELYIAYHHTSEQLNLLNISSGEHYQVTLTKGRTIFGYHWGQEDCLADFALVHSVGVDFYKVQLQPFRLQTVKTYAYTISQYWFEPISGLFVLSHSPTKPGSMRVYTFYSKTSPKFDGPKFKLLQQVPATYHWTTRLHNSLNLTLPITSLDNNQKCSLVRIYSEVYFLHMSFESGHLNLYKITDEKVTKSLLIARSPGVYDLFVIDSVLIIQSFERNEEYFYDIHSSDFHSEPFFIQKYIGKSSISRQKSIHIKGLTPIIIEKTEEFPRNLLRIDEDVWVNLTEGCCYRRELQPLELIQTQENLVEKMMFLLRRTGHKFTALQYLRGEIRNKVQVRQLSELFYVMSKVYRLAVGERQNSPTRLSTRLGNTDQRNSPHFEPELKVQTGTTVLLQTDMHAVVLLDIYENQDFKEARDSRYVTSVMCEYLRSLVDEDILVNPSIQLLTAQQLEKSGNFELLQSMLQYRILNDSLEISHLLIRVANPVGSARYPPALQIALDMLLRLRDFREIADLLLERTLVYEVMTLLDHMDLPLDVLSHIDSWLTADRQPSQLLAEARVFLQRKSSQLVVNS